MVQKKITLFVSCAHLLVGAFILLLEPLQSPPVKKLLVQTISLQSTHAIEPLVIPEEFFAATESSPTLTFTDVTTTPKAAEEVVAVADPVEEIYVEPLPTIQEPKQQEKHIVEEPEIEPKIEKKAPIPIPSKRPTKSETIIAKPIPKSEAKKPFKNAPKPKVQSKVKPKPKPKVEAKKAVKAPAKKTIVKPEKKQTSPKDEMKKIEMAKKQTEDALRKEEKARKSAEEKAARLAKERATKLEIAKNEALLSDALSSLEQVGKLQARKADSASSVAQLAKAPSQISSLASEQIVSIEADSAYSLREKSYYDELVARLKLALKLPEYGEVKVKLTLTRQGKVTKVQVTSSKSRKNKDYIEKALVHTSFPRFGDNFGSDGEHTFQLNLSNELHY